LRRIPLAYNIVEAIHLANHSSELRLRGSVNIWAITSYFNPIGYRRRLENYRIFRKRLNVPLVTVELSQNDDYHLRPGDADILVQIKCPDLLWQKERLFNIGLQSVPRECDTVAWLDCDSVFESDDWAERASKLLETHKIVMPFKCLYELPKNTLPEDASSKRSVTYSFMYAVATGMAPLESLRGNMRLKERVGGGGAGIARRAILEKHGFYDACVMGSGNRAMLCAALGRFDDAIHYLQMNPNWAKHYLAWAEPFFDTVRGSITYLDEDVSHLWHGELENRQYAERHALLKELGFDPAKDIGTDENGCWRWNQPRSDVKEYIFRYFQSRREDG
jgi:hypothetical protein